VAGVDQPVQQRLGDDRVGEEGYQSIGARLALNTGLQPVEPRADTSS
jgi:hypothetical protein